MNLESLIAPGILLKSDSRVLELFSPSKIKLSNFRFGSIFIFNKKEPQSCQFATHRRNAPFEFLASQTGQMAFIFFKVIIR